MMHHSYMIIPKLFLLSVHSPNRKNLEAKILHVFASFFAMGPYKSKGWNNALYLHGYTEFVPLFHFFSELKIWKGSSLVWICERKPQQLGQLIMMACRYLIHAVIEHSPLYLIFCCSCSTQTGCKYETSKTRVFVTPDDFLRNSEGEFQRSHDLVRNTMNIKPQRQKNHYDRTQKRHKYSLNDKLTF